MGFCSARLNSEQENPVRTWRNILFQYTGDKCSVGRRRWPSVFVTNPELKDKKSNSHQGSTQHLLLLCETYKESGNGFLQITTLVWFWKCHSPLYREIKSVSLGSLQLKRKTKTNLGIETKGISQRGLEKLKTNFWCIKSKDLSYEKIQATAAAILVSVSESARDSKFSMLW